MNELISVADNSVLENPPDVVSAQPIFVIDTNILVDYPDIIPNGNGVPDLKEPTIDLSGGHIVIPTAVIRELSSFKKETSERGKVARVVLKRLRKLVEGRSLLMMASYKLEADISVGNQTFSILPVHKNFKNSLPFSPSEDDMDGQIILAALVAEFISQAIPIDGTAKEYDIKAWKPTGRIKLLTNDNGLAIRASQRGVVTSRYGHKLPAPYTGRREMKVPEDLLNYFINEQSVERDIWEMYMDEKWDFVSNEFIIMKRVRSSLDDNDHNLQEESLFRNFRNIGRYDGELDQIVGLEYLKKFPLTVTNAGQAIYAEALMNPNFAAVICTGPAGSGKTYMATVYGYYACKNGDYIGVTVVPCASQSRIGALPGDINDKMDPDVQPFKNALRNFLLKTDKVLKAELKDLRENGARVPKPKTPGDTPPENEEDTRSIRQKLCDRVNAIWDGWFTNFPIETARGRDFSYELSLYDEFQDQNITQADTLIKRLGMEGKIIITGDIYQVHAPYLDTNNNGIVYATQLLYDNPMVAKVQFNEEEVVRHPLVKMIAEKQRADKKHG